MSKGIRWFINRELLLKTPFIRRLAPRFLEKARNNLITMSILFDLHKNERVKVTTQPNLNQAAFDGTTDGIKGSPSKAS